jgi:hypothetical protein
MASDHFNLSSLQAAVAAIALFVVWRLAHRSLRNRALANVAGPPSSSWWSGKCCSSSLSSACGLSSDPPSPHLRRQLPPGIQQEWIYLPYGTRKEVWKCCSDARVLRGTLPIQGRRTRAELLNSTTRLNNFMYSTRWRCTTYLSKASISMKKQENSSRRYSACLPRCGL